jgi:hypothetical protein
MCKTIQLTGISMFIINIIIIIIIMRACSQAGKRRRGP